MTSPKGRRDPHVMLFFALSLIAGFIGLLTAMTAGDDSNVFLIGLAVVLVAIVLFVLFVVRYAKAVRVVAAVKMGAAVKILNQLPATSVASELDRLASLHANGSLTDAEFAAAKAQLLT